MVVINIVNVIAFINIDSWLYKTINIVRKYSSPCTYR